MRFFLSLFAILPAVVGATTIGSWNIEWLDNMSPRYESVRSADDYEALAAVFNESGIDVLAFQEVASADVLKNVVGSDFEILMSSRAKTVTSMQNKPLWRQYTGFAIRRGFEFQRHDDLDLDTNDENRLRYGVDVTLMKEGKPHARLLAVHLKSGCFHHPRDSEEESCETLSDQSEVLVNWIKEREVEGIPYFILGDFNRRIANNKHRWFLSDLSKAAGGKLRVASGNSYSACWSRSYDYRKQEETIKRYPEYIDHIVFGNEGAKIMVPDSFKQTTPTLIDVTTYKLSDHCPISIRLK